MPKVPFILPLRRRAIMFIVRTIFPMSFIVAVARQPATSCDATQGRVAKNLAPNEI